MKKPKELFFFFTIKNAPAFKAALRKLIPSITSTQTLLGNTPTPPDAMLNIAFSNTGLKTLNVTDNLGDSLFTAGQFADAANLKDDNPAKNWVKAFQGTSTHGVFLIASDQDMAITARLNQITTSFGSAIMETYRLSGAARPGPQAGHEREYFVFTPSHEGVS
jgi:deferrochelatase/peroxidase EfeB